MRLVTFRAGNHHGTGMLDADGTTVRDLSPLLGGRGMLDVIADWHQLYPQIRGRHDDPPVVDGAELDAPVPQPRRNVICIGKNFADHSSEFARSGYDASGKGTDLAALPIIFTKAPTAVTGPYDAIERHRGLTSELDYEAELGVVIGRGGRGITAENAYECVFGYTVVNDVTARDLQRDHKQWFLGKSLDTCCPLGPAIVTSDEITPTDVPALEVECWVNGEPRQKARIADLIFDIPTLIATISAGITLLPGDIIATGTPSGVGIGFSPPRFLSAGDTVEISVGGIGTLRNEVR